MKCGLCGKDIETKDIAELGYLCLFGGEEKHNLWLKQLCNICTERIANQITSMKLELHV